MWGEFYLKMQTWTTDLDDEGDAAKNEDEVDYFKQAASLLEEDAGQEGHKHLFAGMSSSMRQNW